MNKRIIFKVQFFILAVCNSANVSDIFKPITESTRHLVVFGGLVGVALPLAIGQARQSYVNKKCEITKSKVSADNFHKEQELVAPSFIRDFELSHTEMQQKLIKLKSNIFPSNASLFKQEYDQSLKSIINNFLDQIDTGEVLTKHYLNYIKENFFERNNYRSWSESQDRQYIESLSDNFFKKALQFTYNSINEKKHYSLELALLQALFLYKHREKIKEKVKEKIDYSKWSACNFTMKSFALCNALILLGYVGFLDKDMRSFMLKVAFLWKN